MLPQTGLGVYKRQPVFPWGRAASRGTTKMIEAMRESVIPHAAAYLAVGGLVIGFLFGAVVFATNFCAMGALSDLHNFGDRRRLLAWLLAAATALVGAQLLQATGVVALERSMYLATPGLNWAGHILGGLAFGFGMVFTGGCPSRNLARAGSGDLRSLLVLVVLGLFAYMTLGGVLAPSRAALEQATSIATMPRSLGDAAARVSGIAPAAGSLVVMAAIALAVLAYCVRDARFRTSPVHVLSGLAVGLIVGSLIGMHAVLFACALGALAGAFAGVMVGLHGGTRYEATVRHPVETAGGRMIAICVDRPGMERLAVEALRANNARDVGRTEGEWRGGWRDFDPRTPLAAV